MKDWQERWLWAGAMYATNFDPAFAALAFKAWATTVRRGWVVLEVVT